MEPLTRHETRMHVTVSPAFMALLKKARVGQSHVQPGATDEQILTSALELLIDKQAKRKASVPAKVKREVRKRDGGKCQWPVASGGICGSEVRRRWTTWCRAGRVGRPRWRTAGSFARSHNLEAARGVYGDEVMDRYARNPVVRETCAVYCVDGAVAPALAAASAGSIASAAWNAARASSPRPSLRRFSPAPWRAAPAPARSGARVQRHHGARVIALVRLEPGVEVERVGLAGGDADGVQVGGAGALRPPEPLLGDSQVHVGAPVPGRDADGGLERRDRPGVLPAGRVGDRQVVVHHHVPRRLLDLRLPEREVAPPVGGADRGPDPQHGDQRDDRHHHERRSPERSDERPGGDAEARRRQVGEPLGHEHADGEDVEHGEQRAEGPEDAGRR